MGRSKHLRAPRGVQIHSGAVNQFYEFVFPHGVYFYESLLHDHDPNDRSKFLLA
jgi:hypothetical protein